MLREIDINPTSADFMNLVVGEFIITRGITISSGWMLLPHEGLLLCTQATQFSSTLVPTNVLFDSNY